MNSNAQIAFALLSTFLFGLVGYYIGRAFEQVGAPSFMEFVGIMWPIILGVGFVASFIYLAIIATDLE